MAGARRGGQEHSGSQGAGSGLLWLQWGWQMETGLEGEGMLPKSLDLLGPQPADCSLTL